MSVNGVFCTVMDKKRRPHRKFNAAKFEESFSLHQDQERNKVLSKLV